MAYLDCVGPRSSTRTAAEEEALTDGLLLIRCFFGFRDGALIADALAGNCARCDGDLIEAYIEADLPLGER